MCRWSLLCLSLYLCITASLMFVVFLWVSVFSDLCMLPLRGCHCISDLCGTFLLFLSLYLLISVALLWLSLHIWSLWHFCGCLCTFWSLWLFCGCLCIFWSLWLFFGCLSSDLCGFSMVVSASLISVVLLWLALHLWSLWLFCDCLCVFWSLRSCFCNYTDLCDSVILLADL